MEWMSAVAASRRYGVSTRTLRRYTESGKLADVRGAGGRRIFLKSDLDALLLNRSGSRVVAYARVSSRHQQADGELDRQAERLVASQPGADVAVYTDVASGLSDRRAGLRKALTACMSADVHVLIAEHPDRLSRFGTGVIEHLLSGFGVTVRYIGEPEDASPDGELLNDLVAIVTSFAGRLYGQRSARAKRLLSAVLAETRSGTDSPREDER